MKVLSGTVAALTGGVPQILSRFPSLRAPLRFVHRCYTARRPWMRAHPLDEEHGVTTSGYLPWWLLGTGAATDRENSGYAGCQPSCLRRALSIIPEPTRYAYLDLGCGKGRSLVVASELPFRKIVGIEIAPDLAKTARVNAAVVDKRFPRRTLIEVTTGDASLAPLPEGDLVIFLYHSFGENLLRHLVTRLVEAAPGRTIFFVYENPAYGRLLDAAPGFSRWFAEMVPCDPVERGYAPNDSEAIVIWRSGGDVSQAELLGCQARIEGTPWRAVLAPVDARLEGAAHMS